MGQYETINSRVKISSPWIPELADTFHVGDETYLRINIINCDTGEIRQRVVSLDRIARILFPKRNPYRGIPTEPKNKQ